MPSPPTLIAMPRLGMTMREGRLVEWLIAAGGAVERGRPLFVIESDKAEIEIEAPASGWLRHVFVLPGTTVPCGEPLAALTASSDEPFDPAAFLSGLGRSPETSPAGGVASRPAPSPQAGPERTREAAPTTPAARRRALELGVDPRHLRGTGPGGRVTREDVEAFAIALAARREVAPGVLLEVRESGEGPLVLLIPGFGADLSTFGFFQRGGVREMLCFVARTVAKRTPPGTRQVGGREWEWREEGGRKAFGRAALAPSHPPPPLPFSLDRPKRGLLLPRPQRRRPHRHRVCRRRLPRARRVRRRRRRPRRLSLRRRRLLGRRRRRFRRRQRGVRGRGRPVSRPSGGGPAHRRPARPGRDPSRAAQDD